jgi:hypothetical protein
LSEHRFDEPSDRRTAAGFARSGLYKRRPDDRYRRAGDTGGCLTYGRGIGHAEGRVNLGRAGSNGRRRISGSVARVMAEEAVPVVARSAFALVAVAVALRCGDR